jgi:hypothetical protein
VSVSGSSARSARKRPGVGSGRRSRDGLGLRRTLALARLFMSVRASSMRSCRVCGSSSSESESAFFLRKFRGAILTKGARCGGTQRARLEMRERANGTFRHRTGTKLFFFSGFPSSARTGAFLSEQTRPPTLRPARRAKSHARDRGACSVACVRRHRTADRPTHLRPSRDRSERRRRSRLRGRAHARRKREHGLDTPPPAARFRAGRHPRVFVRHGRYAVRHGPDSPRGVRGPSHGARQERRRPHRRRVFPRAHRGQDQRGHLPGSVPRAGQRDAREDVGREGG